MAVLGKEANGVIYRNTKGDTENQCCTPFNGISIKPIMPAVIINAIKLGISEIRIIRALAKRKSHGQGDQEECQYQAFGKVVDEKLISLG